MAKPSLMDQMKAAAAAEENTATEVATEQLTETVSFEVTEATIKSNPAYKIISDPKKSLAQRVEELTALKAYNAELSPEENAANIEALEEFLLYSENTILELADRQAAFTNDDAFSLYDQNIQRLQDGLETFKSTIQPLADAFGVMQRAKAAGIAPHRLLQEVQDKKDVVSDLETRIADANDAVVAKEAGMQHIVDESSAAMAKLNSYEQRITDAQEKKDAANTVIKTESEKGFFSKDRKAIRHAESQIETADDTITRATASIESLKGPAQIAAQNLATHNEELDGLRNEAITAEVELEAAKSELTGDPDTEALAKLLEITGEEFTDQREALTENVRTLLKDTVADFERSMGRFASGHEEVMTLRNTVENVEGLNEVIVKASKEAKVLDSEYVLGQRGIIDRIKEEKGDDAVYDPDFEVARREYTHANKHAEGGRDIEGKALGLADKLARQKASYTGLADAFDQKRNDSQRLRTHAAVEVSSKLLTCIKGLELAIASERTTAADDILSELGGSAMETTTQIFDMVASNAGEENDRLAQALKQSLETAEAITGITESLREETRKADLQKRALEEMTENVSDLTEGLSNVRGDVSRELASSDDLDEQVAGAAAKAIKGGGPGVEDKRTKAPVFAI